jgi:hypothetical protein
VAVHGTIGTNILFIYSNYKLSQMVWDNEKVDIAAACRSAAGGID